MRGAVVSLSFGRSAVYCAITASTDRHGRIPSGFRISDPPAPRTNKSYPHELLLENLTAGRVFGFLVFVFRNEGRPCYICVHVIGIVRFHFRPSSLRRGHGKSGQRKLRRQRRRSEHLKTGPRGTYTQTNGVYYLGTKFGMARCHVNADAVLILSSLASAFTTTTESNASIRFQTGDKIIL